LQRALQVPSTRTTTTTTTVLENCEYCQYSSTGRKVVHTSTSTTVVRHVEYSTVSYCTGCLSAAILGCQTRHGHHQSPRWRQGHQSAHDRLLHLLLDDRKKSGRSEIFQRTNASFWCCCHTRTTRYARFFSTTVHVSMCMKDPSLLNLSNPIWPPMGGGI
jgi:hypothetical protein